MMDSEQLNKMAALETCPICGLAGKMKFENTEIIHITKERIDRIFCNFKCSCGALKTVPVPTLNEKPEVIVNEGEIKSPSNPLTKKVKTFKKR